MNFSDMKKVAKIISSKSSSTTSSELPPPPNQLWRITIKTFPRKQWLPVIIQSRLPDSVKNFNIYSIYGTQQVIQFFIILKIMINRKNDREKGQITFSRQLTFCKIDINLVNDIPSPLLPYLDLPFSLDGLSLFSSADDRHHPIIGILGYFWGANIHLGPITPASHIWASPPFLLMGFLCFHPQTVKGI